MKWSTQKINDLHKYLVDNSTLNVSPIIRDLKISSLLSDQVPFEFPYYTEGEFIKVPFIKKGYIQIEYTTEEINSLSGIKSDASILSQFIKINDQGGIIDFNLYDKQREFVQNYTNYRFNIIKHSRQVGMSQLMSLIVLHYITTKNGKKVVWICENYKHDFDRFMNFLSFLPFYISPGIVKIKDNLNTKEVLFDNNCCIVFTKSFINNPFRRKEEGDFVVIDNAAYIELDKALTLLTPGLISKFDTQFFIISSQNKNSYFEKIFKDKYNGWNKLTMNWDVVPNRDEKWVLKKLYEMGDYQKFLEEYDVESNVSKLRDLTINLLMNTDLN